MSIPGMPIGQSTWRALSPSLDDSDPLGCVIKVQDDLSRGRKMHCFTSSDDEIWMMGHVSLVLHVQARAARRRHVGGVDLRGTRTLGSVLSSVHCSLTEVSQPIRLFSLICLFNDSSFTSWFSCFLLKLLLLPYISLSLSLILQTCGR